MTKHHLLLLSSLGIVVGGYVFRDNLAQLSSLGLVGIFIVNFIGSATLFLPAPAIATVVAGGVVYPAIAVALSAAIGAALGDMVGYLMGHSGKKVLLKKHPKTYIIVKDMFHKFGPVAIFLFALIPNPVFDAVGIFSGMFLYPAARFFVLMVVARFIRNIILASVGAAFR
jgi:membrane protein YqaA with SNARE-associated domain